MDEKKKFDPRDNLKPFVKGDPRINRKGRPKDFTKLRALAQMLASEKATDKDGQPIVRDGHIATNVEMILRSMMRDPKLMAAFLEVAYGKTPTQIDVTSGGESLGIPAEERVERALAIFAAAQADTDTKSSE